MRSLPSLALVLLGTACMQSIAPVVLPSPEAARSEPSGPGFTLPSPAAAPASGASSIASHDLAFPVAGASIDRVTDSFDDQRDGGRVHHAIDILAPRGTPVVSADNGRILRLSTSTLGGITIYASDESQRFVYYYAHLNGYRDGLAAGARISRGDTLGYVGTTGNAPKDTPHLHFQIMHMTVDPSQFWNGEPIDPYPLYKALERRRVATHPD